MVKARFSKRVEPISKYIICIEGIDGCGKDTQLKLLRNKGYYVTSEPNYESPVGALLQGVLTKKITLKSKLSLEYLFAADRSEHVEIMKRHVEEGTTPKSKICITGRYKYSGLVYSEIPKITFYLSNTIPEAGLFIFLEIDPEKAMERIINRDPNAQELYENLEKLTVVNDEFTKIIRTFKRDAENEDVMVPEVVIINADLSPDEIHNQIIKTIDEYIETRLPQ